jgi:Fe-S-cluster containining protein
MNHKALINHLRALTDHESFCKKGCIVCCTKQPWSWTWEEWDRIPNKKYALPGDPCPYVQTMGCGIYSERPIVCRLVGLFPGLIDQYYFGCPEEQRPNKILMYEEVRPIVEAYLSIVLKERDEIRKTGAVFVPAGPFGVGLFGVGLLNFLKRS